MNLLLDGETTKRHPRTTRLKLEVVDRIEYEMQECSTKNMLLDKINNCQYDMEIARVLVDSMIKMANDKADNCIALRTTSKSPDIMDTLIKEMTTRDKRWS